MLDSPDPAKMGSKKISLPPFEEAKEVLAHWQPEQEAFFIAMLKDIVISRGDNRVASTFSKVEWKGMQKKHYMKWGLKYNIKALKNKYTGLKERFREFHNLINAASGLGWHQILVTVDAEESWWDEYTKTHPTFKNIKRFRALGCPEFKDLEVIFNDTIAIGNLQASTNHDFNSTDDKNSHNEAITESSTPREFENVGDSNDHKKNDLMNQSKSLICTRKRGRNDSMGSDLPEAVRMLVKASSARTESRGKFTITECIDVIDAMGVDIGRRAYAKLISLIQNKGWREAFLHMSDARRKDIVESIEEGDI